jgi:hypothetical protein
MFKLYKTWGKLPRRTKHFIVAYNSGLRWRDAHGAICSTAQKYREKFQSFSTNRQVDYKFYENYRENTLLYPTWALRIA